MLINCKSQVEWVNKVELELLDFKGESLKVLLPAGNTPEALYQKWRNDFPEAFKHFQFMQLDEILDGQNRFQKFFKNELPKLNVIPPGLVDVQADIAILGLGLNGHIGFHEPHIPKNFYGGCVQLCPETCKNLGVKENTWGVTYGIRAILNCKKIILIVRGSNKQMILKQVLSNDQTLPASHLMGHANFKIINLGN